MTNSAQAQSDTKTETVKASDAAATKTVATEVNPEDKAPVTADSQPVVPEPKPIVSESKPAVEASAKESTSSSQSFENDAKTTSDTEQVVVFKLADEEYASPILDVQEIIPTGDITPFPNVDSYIEGIINVRGTVATILNLSKKFGLTRTDEGNKDKYIVLTKIGSALFGMMVDEVTSVMKIAKSDIKESDGMDTQVSKDYISSVAVVGERIILILDFKKILGEEDLAKLTQI